MRTTWVKFLSWWVGVMEDEELPGGSAEDEEQLPEEGSSEVLGWSGSGNLMLWVDCKQEV